MKKFFEDVKFLFTEGIGLVLSVLLFLLLLAIWVYLLVTNKAGSVNDVMWYVIGHNIYK